LPLCIRVIFAKRFLPGIASRQEKAAIARRTPMSTNILFVKAFFVQQETKTAMFE